MKIKTILNTLEGLSSIVKKSMPATVTYALLKNTKQLEAEQSYFIQLQDTLIKECVEIEEDGSFKTVEGTPNKFILKEDKIEYYNTEMEKIMNLDVNINIQTIPFEAIENLNLTLEEMSVLEFMIKEEG